MRPVAADSVRVIKLPFSVNEEPNSGVRIDFWGTGERNWRVQIPSLSCILIFECSLDQRHRNHKPLPLLHIFFIVFPSPWIMLHSIYPFYIIYTSTNYLHKIIQQA